MAGNTKMGHCNVCGIVKKATVKLHLCEKRCYESAVARNRIVKTKSASVFRRAKHARAYANVLTVKIKTLKKKIAAQKKKKKKQKIYKKISTLIWILKMETSLTR